jgi:hypothetical protein
MGLSKSFTSSGNDIVDEFLFCKWLTSYGEIFNVRLHLHEEDFHCLVLVGGMTPGMSKACQTGWFEPSGYRLDVHAGV